jgi:hypothetical protein
MDERTQDDEAFADFLRRSKRPNGEDSSPRFVLIPFDSVQIETTPAYRVKGILPRFGLCIVWGPPKCGKSFLVFDMVMHVALGWKYRGKKVRQGPVVYCALEGSGPFKNRIEAFRQTRLAEDTANVPFDLVATPMTLVADHPALIQAIGLRDLSPSIVVIDTLNRSLAGSESKDEDMSAYVRAADAVRDTGSAGQARTVPYATATKAHDALIKQRLSKERRGYRENLLPLSFVKGG